MAIIKRMVGFLFPYIGEEANWLLGKTCPSLSEASKLVEKSTHLRLDGISLFFAMLALFLGIFSFINTSNFSLISFCLFYFSTFLAFRFFHIKNKIYPASLFLIFLIFLASSFSYFWSNYPYFQKESSIVLIPFISISASLAILPLGILHTLISVLIISIFFFVASIPISDPFYILVFILIFSMFSSLGQRSLALYVAREGSLDRLTGMLGRRSMESLIAARFSESKRKQEHITIAFLDLDKFKSINDSFGHGAGDDVLKNAAFSIKQSLRSSDIAGRWGGEEFVILFSSCKQGAIDALQRIVENGLGMRPDGDKLTASIGVCCSCEINSSNDNWSTICRIADSRMYEAKKGGRNKIIA